MRPQARSWKPGANTEHRGMRAAGPGATQPPCASFPFQMDPVQKAVISHTFGVPTPLKKKQFISCNICHLRFNSAVSWHGAGLERGVGWASGVLIPQPHWDAERAGRGAPRPHIPRQGTKQRSSSLLLALALRSPWLMLPMAGWWKMFPPCS